MQTHSQERQTHIPHYVSRALGLSWLACLLVTFSGTAAAATHEVAAGGNGPFFEPDTLTIQPGDTVKWIWGGGGFTHTVTSGKNGVADGYFESGSHKAPFTFSFTFPDAGEFEYFCKPHLSMGMVGVIKVVAPSTPTPVPTAPPTGSPAQPLNVSTRLRVQSGQNAMIGGFIVTGNAAKRVIVRAIGPSLGSAGVAGVVNDPIVSLNGSGGGIASNDNWRDSQQADIEASGVQPSDQRESAIIATLQPGSYTAVVEGKDQTSGVGLVEVYDLDQPADSKLANISTRGVVETGSDVMIGGFILGKGTGAARIIVRAIGPTLTESGISGVLADPTLELRDGNGQLVRSNNNWKESQQGEIEATGIPPRNDLESAIVATLTPAPYTAVVSGVNGTTGVGLVEVYQLQ